MGNDVVLGGGVSFEENYRRNQAGTLIENLISAGSAIVRTKCSSISRTPDTWDNIQQLIPKIERCDDTNKLILYTEYLATLYEVAYDECEELCETLDDGFPLQQWRSDESAAPGFASTILAKYDLAAARMAILKDRRQLLPVYTQVQPPVPVQRSSAVLRTEPETSVMCAN